MSIKLVCKQKVYGGQMIGIFGELFTLVNKDVLISDGFTITITEVVYGAPM